MEKGNDNKNILRRATTNSFPTIYSFASLSSNPTALNFFTRVYFCFVLTSSCLWVICYKKKDIWTSIDLKVINFPFTRRDTNKQQLELIFALSFFSWIISLLSSGVTNKISIEIILLNLKATTLCLARKAVSKYITFIRYIFWMNMGPCSKGHFMYL